MVRRLLAFIVGLIVGFLVVAMVQGISSSIYQPPPELDFQDRDALQDWIATLPTGAFVWVLVAHASGALAAAFACVAVFREPWPLGALLLGVLFLAAGIMNLMMIPHPLWFGIADVILYLPAAWVGGLLATRICTASERQHRETSAS